MIDLPLPKSTRALFNIAEIGDVESATVASSSSAVTLALSRLSSDSAVQAFLVFMAKKAAGAAAALCRFPGLCVPTAGVALAGGQSGTPAPLIEVPSDSARRRLRRTT